MVARYQAACGLCPSNIRRRSQETEVRSQEKAAVLQFEFHGTGTALYGRRDFMLDRSFVTTEWITLAYLPIIPLISKRISFTRLDPYHACDRSGHYIVELMPLNMTQVLSVYAWAASFVAYCAFWAYFGEAMVRKVGDEVALEWLLATLAMLVVLPYALRRFAIWRGSRSFHRATYGLGPRSLD
jgi:hypothetical protein